MNRQKNNYAQWWMLGLIILLSISGLIFSISSKSVSLGKYSEHGTKIEKKTSTISDACSALYTNLFEWHRY